ncbi:peroxiredoxin [Halostagnicola bangensis]
MPLSEGTAVQAVSATDQNGDERRLEFAEPTVLYFYPRDATPGCTTEARQFDRELESYRDAGVTVYGVSTDDVDSHQEFCEAEGLGFDLLADPEGELTDAFDVDRSGGAAARTTYFLDDGEVKTVYENVDPDGHARAVLGDALEAGHVTLSE